MIFVCIGACVPVMRIISSIFGHAVCLFHFCVIVMTAVFRFRHQGRLCAMNKTLTYWESSTEKMTHDKFDDWDYRDDSKGILAIWIIQCVTFLGCTMFASYPNVPRK